MTTKQLELFNNLPTKKVNTVRVGTTLKGFQRASSIPSATWSSGGALNTLRYRASTSDSGG